MRLAGALLGGQLEIGRADGLQRLQDAGPNFAGFRMAAHLVFREDQLAIDRDVKDAAGGRDQFPTADEILNFAFVQDLIRQTDGIGLVSSSGAILDDNIHSTFLHEISPLQSLGSYDASSIAQRRRDCKSDLDW